MSISCDCSVGVDDCADLYRDEFPKARKPHKCYECGESILPGQKYQKSTILFECRWSEYKTCMPCFRVRDRYCHYGFYFGELRKLTIECLGFDYTEVPEGDDESG